MSSFLFAFRGDKRSLFWVDQFAVNAKYCGIYDRGFTEWFYALWEEILQLFFDDYL